MAFIKIADAYEKLLETHKDQDPEEAARAKAASGNLLLETVWRGNYCLSLRSPGSGSGAYESSRLRLVLGLVVLDFRSLIVELFMEMHE